LKALHSKNIIHLDLKPENMIIFGKNKVKLCDLESSMTLEYIKEAEDNKKELEIKSTINYAGPEVLT